MQQQALVGRLNSVSRLCGNAVSLSDSNVILSVFRTSHLRLATIILSWSSLMQSTSRGLLPLAGPTMPAFSS